MTIKHLAYRVANNAKLGLASLAEAMGMKHQTLINCLNVNSDTHNLNISKFEELADFADGNLAIAEYFAAKANSVVVILPLIPDESDMGLLDGYLAIMKELGELALTFQKSYADGDINQKEFGDIKVEVSDAISKLLAFEAQIKRVVR